MLHVLFLPPEGSVNEESTGRTSECCWRRVHHVQHQGRKEGEQSKFICSSTSKFTQFNIIPHLHDLYNYIKLVSTLGIYLTPCTFRGGVRASHLRSIHIRLILKQNNRIIVPSYKSYLMMIHRPSRGFQSLTWWTFCCVVFIRVAADVYILTTRCVYFDCSMYIFWLLDIYDASNHRATTVHKTYTVSNVESQFFHLKYNLRGPGIEPRMTACQADVLTTTLPRLSIYVLSCCPFQLQYWRPLAMLMRDYKFLNQLLTFDIVSGFPN